MIKRREFIAGLGSAAAWPVAARAQQKPERVRRIGVFTNLAEDDPETLRRVTAVVQVDHRHCRPAADETVVRIDYRSGLADTDRYRRYAAELVALAPDVLLANGGATLGALQQVTRILPIVFVQTTDPVSVATWRAWRDQVATSRFPSFQMSP